ncbi:MAG TPA: hypothetical protein VIN75_04965 [Burkholderiaceae bacterium]
MTRRLRSWPALLLAPLTALAQQSICLSLLKHACEQQTTAPVHAVSAVSLVAILAMTWLAAAEWLASRALTDHRPGAAQRDDTTPTRLAHFLAGVGMLVGGLSALVALFMWMPVWVLNPCMD